VRVALVAVPAVRTGHGQRVPAQPRPRPQRDLPRQPHPVRVQPPTPARQPRRRTHQILRRMSDSEDIGPTPGDLTPYLRLDDVLINYAHTSRDVLGDNFVGLYLLGSLAIGDFDLTSDVDFMVATKDELSDEELNRVQSAHMNFIARDTRWVKHFEYSWFSMQTLDAKSCSARAGTGDFRTGGDGQRATTGDQKLDARMGEACPRRCFAI
jgi:predicted nucleotidyltransferase